jgi:hypothetical protein
MSFLHRIHKELVQFWFKIHADVFCQGSVGKIITGFSTVKTYGKSSGNFFR